MLTSRLALLSLSLIFTICQAQTSTKYKIEFKLAVMDVQSFDVDWEENVGKSYPGDLSDIFLYLYFGGRMIGQTQIKKNVINAEFDEKFEIDYDADVNGKKFLVVQVFDDDTKQGETRYDADHFIGNVYMKLSEVAKIGKKEFPIVDGAEFHGKLAINTYAIISDGMRCTIL